MKSYTVSFDIVKKCKGKIQVDDLLNVNIDYTLVSKVTPVITEILLEKEIQEVNLLKNPTVKGDFNNGGTHE